MQEWKLPILYFSKRRVSRYQYESYDTTITKIISNIYIYQFFWASFKAWILFRILNDYSNFVNFFAININNKANFKKDTQYALQTSLWAIQLIINYYSRVSS